MWTDAAPRQCQLLHVSTTSSMHSGVLTLCRNHGVWKPGFYKPGFEPGFCHAKPGFYPGNGTLPLLLLKFYPQLAGKLFSTDSSELTKQKSECGTLYQLPTKLSPFSLEEVT